MDARSELVRRAVLPPANVNETEVADALIVGDERAVYGDAAYGTHARHAQLRARGIKDQLMRRPVEHVFGTLKRSYGYRHVRYVGLARNTTEVWFKLLAYNLRRADRLLAPATP